MPQMWAWVGCPPRCPKNSGSLDQSGDGIEKSYGALECVINSIRGNKKVEKNAQAFLLLRFWMGVVSPTQPYVANCSSCLPVHIVTI